MKKEYVIKDLQTGKYFRNHVSEDWTNLVYCAYTYPAKKFAKYEAARMISNSETTMWLEIVTVYTN